ncbi:MAG: hypothetical protein U0905_04500 [Pirellulales bacterium]
MNRVARLLQGGRYEQAIQTADDIVAQGGRFPDVLSQRGLARFYSIIAVRLKIEINPFHYVS